MYGNVWLFVGADKADVKVSVNECFKLREMGREWTSWSCLGLRCYIFLLKTIIISLICKSVSGI